MRRSSGDRVLVVINAEVDQGVLFRGDDLDPGGLAAAAVAAGGLPGFQDAASGAPGSSSSERLLELGGHRLDHAFAGEDVAQANVAAAGDVPGPGDAALAGVGGGAAVLVDDAELTHLAARVGLDEALDDALRGQPLLRAGRARRSPR